MGASTTIDSTVVAEEEVDDVGMWIGGGWRAWCGESKTWCWVGVGGKADGVIAHIVEVRTARVCVASRFTGGTPKMGERPFPRKGDARELGREGEGTPEWRSRQGAIHGRAVTADHGLRFLAQLCGIEARLVQLPRAEAPSCNCLASKPASCKCVGQKPNA